MRKQKILSIALFLVTTIAFLSSSLSSMTVGMRCASGDETMKRPLCARRCDFDGFISDVGDIPPLGNTIIDYNLTDNWGGMWCDAEKTADDPDDDDMCWAAAAANVLEWTGWGFVEHPTDGKMTNCDQMFEHINDHWVDTGGWPKEAWDWWFNGTAYGNVDVAGGGDFWTPPHTFSDYYHEYDVWPSAPTNTLQKIDEFLSNGWGVALAIYDGAHAITCWGFRYNSSVNKATDPEDYYLGIYVTDSDDNAGSNSWTPPPDRIKYLSVTYNGSHWKFSSGWHIEFVYALERNPSLDPDLAIYKTAYPDVAIAGEELFYNITVVNENEIVGGITAYNVTVTDTLPVGVIYIADTGGGELLSGRTYSWSLGDIVPGDSRSFTIKVRVDSDYVINQGSTITNTANVTSITPCWESDLTNNEATVTTPVQDEADLKVTKICKPDTTVLAGELINCTIIVENLGPSYARNVSIRDTVLYSGTIDLSILINDPSRDDTSSARTTGLENEGVMVFEFELNDPLEPKDVDLSGAWIVQVQLKSEQGIDINNVVNVFTEDEDGTPDPDLSNNQAEGSISVTAVADLELTKSGPPSVTTCILREEPTFECTLTVTNHGPSTAVNVLIEDWLPAGVSINSVTSSQGSCNAGVPGDASRPTTCAIDSLAKDALATVTINVTVLKPADLSMESWILHNDAQVFSDTLDLNNTNNLASLNTTIINTCIQEPADLKVIKFCKPDTTVLAGEIINYTIIVENLGPSYAYNVSIRDEILSSGNFELLSIILDSTRGAQKNTTWDGTIECDLLEALEPKNASRQGRWIIHILLRANETQDINNVVNVFTRTARTLDPDLSNNEAQCSIHITAVADLEITKIDNPDPAGCPHTRILTYNLTVTNHGPSTAVNVLVKDWLPAPVTILSLSATGDGSCNAGIPGDSTRPTTCTFGTLAPGASENFTIVVLVPRAPRNKELPLLRNDAQVSSDTLDLNNSNNLATEDTEYGESKWLNTSSTDVYIIPPFGLITLSGLASSFAAIRLRKKTTIQSLLKRFARILRR